jgi:DNA-binding LacI/PurR family transcriptional regulator
MVGLLLTTNLPQYTRVSLFQLADEEAGREAVRHLVVAGCRELLFVGRQDLPSSRARWQGAADEAERTGISLDFIDCHLNYAAGLRLGRELSLKAPLTTPLTTTTEASSVATFAGKKTGIIAANDWLAVGLRAGLAQNLVAGLTPLIVSFDGLPISADPLFAIDSLEVPLDTIAVDAIRELQRLCQPVPMAGRVVRYGLSWR